VGYYKYALELTNQTKMWEKSINICNKMEEIVRDQLFSYDEASSILEWKARFFTNAIQDGRFFPSYYKINLVGIDYSDVKSNVILYNLILNLNITNLSKLNSLFWPKNSQILQKSSKKSKKHILKSSF